jgi:hypothetical protein
MASSSTTISISVLDTKASSAATEFLDGLPLEETETAAWGIEQPAVRIIVFMSRYRFCQEGV